MGEINREGILNLVNNVIDVADNVKDVVLDVVDMVQEVVEPKQSETKQEPAEEPAEGGLGYKPVGTVIWMKDNDEDLDSGYLHFKVSEDEWLEFSINTYDSGDGLVSVRPSGKNPSYNIDNLAQSSWWTAKVLTEDA